MCDHQRQTSRYGAPLPCAYPECQEQWFGSEIRDEDTDDRYTRECFLPAPTGTPAFWFWLRRDA